MRGADFSDGCAWQMMEVARRRSWAGGWVGGFFSLQLFALSVFHNHNLSKKGEGRREIIIRLNEVEKGVGISRFLLL